MIRKVNEKSIWAQIEIQEILVGNEKNHTVKVNEYWRMLPRDVFGISIFEDGQISTGHSPEQPTVAQLSFSKILDRMISRGTKLKTRF